MCLCAVVALCFAARYLLDPILKDDSPYLFFVPAVLVAAGIGGLGPGLVATLLSGLIGYFVISAGHHTLSDAAAPRIY
jgi:two-component system, LuxR family, sensor kinase FixL